MFNFENSNKQWDYWLWTAIAYFTSVWYHVCIPLTDHQDYDLVVDINNFLYKVQVKTTWYKNEANNYVVALRTNWWNRSWAWKTKHFDKNVSDLLFILCSDSTKYLIPVSDVTSINSISLYDKYDEYIV